MNEKFLARYSDGRMPRTHTRGFLTLALMHHLEYSFQIEDGRWGWMGRMGRWGDGEMGRWADGWVDGIHVDGFMSTCRYVHVLHIFYIHIIEK